MTIAKQERDFVPSMRVAPVVANPGTVSVTLPGTTAAFAAANIYARATGYIAKRTSILGIASRQEICWRNWRCRSSMTKYPRTRRRSISSGRR
jgi:hypothetical protein